MIGQYLRKRISTVVGMLMLAGVLIIFFFIFFTAHKAESILFQELADSAALIFKAR